MIKHIWRWVAVLSLSPCFLLSGHDVVTVVKRGVERVAARCGYDGQVRGEVRTAR